MLLKVGLLALVIGIGSTSDDQLINEPVVPMECKNGTRNIYGSFGCNSSYYHCENGLPIKKECPINHYFDIAQLKCKFHSQDQDCDHGFQMNKDDLPACDDNKFVSNMECSRFYGHCVNGEVVRKSCPYNNVWVQEDETCNNIERVEACKRKTSESKIQNKSTTEPSSTTKPKLQSTHLQELVINPYFPRLEPHDLQEKHEEPTHQDQQKRFSCQGKPDGYYVQGCSNSYWGCVSGVTFLYQCKGMNLFFSAQTLRCDLKQSVPECGGRIQPTTQPPQIQPQQQPQPLPTLDMTTLCAKKVNGFYSTPCSREYITCKNFKTTQFFCPDTLVFDSTISQCNDWKNVPACQSSLTVRPTAQPQESTTTPTPAPATTVLVYNNPIVIILLIVVIIISLLSIALLTFLVKKILDFSKISQNFSVERI